MLSGRSRGDERDKEIFQWESKNSGSTRNQRTNDPDIVHLSFGL